ncbi:hypothetical protein O7606_16675 [Micromonospora sp. WMMD882]|uniref:hypothetical protein n=1 Tax=Micromonospora sp. WMMD882 TaxID=3015151 RepID=UPI00248CBBE3|nr:hypothetical protein [Micromonospora sp. WMMD882]WBB77897.1 hypothetical protein O7606_16675 [Micromonospora sp. WMMD882]
MFLDADTGSCASPEVGARVGGAEIPLLWREVHGHDPVETAFAIRMGLEIGTAVPRLADEVGGWLLVPAPVERPCRVTEITRSTHGPDRHVCRSGPRFCGDASLMGPAHRR